MRKSIYVLAKRLRFRNQKIVAQSHKSSDCVLVDRLLFAALTVVGLFQFTHRVLAQDSLRIIELSGPGESAPVNVPAGHVFTFSLFAPQAADSDYDAAVGVVAYAVPVSYVYEHRFRSYDYAQYWFVGPASVALRGSAAGARMQLYTMKLPPGVKAGILSAQASSHSVAIPKGSLLTSLLGFSGQVSHSTAPIGPWVHHLSIQSPSGTVYGVSRLDALFGYYFRIPTPRILGAASLHNPNAPASSVVRGFYYDDLDSVSPTADFVGPGTATFFLPPEGERSTPIAFYCYRLTKANATFVDSTPPIITVTQPESGSDTTAMASYIVSGAVTDDVNPTRISFRMRSPNNPNFGNWAPVNLAGANATKNWSRTISLSAQGSWQIEIQAFDAANNGSEVRSVSLTRQ